MQQISTLFLREWYRVRSGLFDHMLNFFVIWPFLFGVGSGYIAPLTYFGVNPYKATTLFVGMVLMQLVIVAYDGAMLILSERIGSKVLQYHTLSSSLKTVFLVRAGFSVLFTMFLMLPFLPVVRLMLGSYFHAVNTSWPLVLLATSLGSLLSVSYALILSSLITDMTEGMNMWIRFIEPLMWFGGMWVPLFAMHKALPLAGALARFNPFMYVTEAIRFAVLGDAIYTPIWQCSLIILSASTLFFIISYHLLKKRIDAV